MADDFATMQGVLESLKAAGPDAAEPVLDAIEAAKRYIYGVAAKNGVGQPYQGPDGLTPTAEELPELIDGLRGWASRHASTCDTSPLSRFRQVELSRLSPSGASYASGFISCGPPDNGAWATAGQRAVETLDELSAVVVERREEQGDQENSPGVVDLDQLAALFHLQKPSTGNAQQRTNELLVRLSGLLREQENRRNQGGGYDVGKGDRTAAGQRELLLWITVSQAAKLIGVNRGVVSRLADAREIRTNGKKGRARRIFTLDAVCLIFARANRPEPKESNAQVTKLVRRNVK